MFWLDVFVPEKSMPSEYCATINESTPSYYTMEELEQNVFDYKICCLSPTDFRLDGLFYFDYELPNQHDFYICCCFCCSFHNIFCMMTGSTEFMAAV